MRKEQTMKTISKFVFYACSTTMFVTIDVLAGSVWVPLYVCVRSWRLQSIVSDRMSSKSNVSSVRSYCKHIASSPLWQPGIYQTRTMYLQRLYGTLRSLEACASNRSYAQVFKCLNKNLIVVITWWILAELSLSWSMRHHTGATSGLGRSSILNNLRPNYSPRLIPSALSVDREPNHIHNCIATRTNPIDLKLLSSSQQHKWTHVCRHVRLSRTLCCFTMPHVERRTVHR